MSILSAIQIRNNKILSRAREIKSKMPKAEHTNRLQKVLSLGIKGPTLKEYCAQI
ncbi:hypothetical protein GW765_00780 [Candidatus Parcubacteria bacterium]|nr:hypothetical protein [Candidatus Parcubacteria bacterium]